MTQPQTNVPYHGDNLEILRRYVPDASVDLVPQTGCENSITPTT